MLAALPVQSWAAAAMTVAFTCSINGKADQAVVNQVCAEFRDVVSKAYPHVTFTADAAENGGATLDLTLSQATRSGLSLALVWRAFEGRDVTSETQSVSAMNRDVTPSMRNSLYRRLVEAAPMPH